MARTQAFCSSVALPTVLARASSLLLCRTLPLPRLSPTPRRVRTSPSWTSCTPTPTPDPVQPTATPAPASASAPTWRLPLAGLTYLVFVVHNLVFGPGPLLSAGTIGQILTRQTGDVNDLVIAIFYALGVVGGVHAALLIPGAPAQKKSFPTLPSTIAGMLLGFFGVGPYLAARVYAPSVTAEDFAAENGFSRFLGGRVFGVSLLASALYVYALGLGLFAPAEIRDVIFYACWEDTGKLFMTDRGIHATLIDGTLLCSVMMWGPLTEDMRRRGWDFTGNDKISSYLNALTIMLAPVLGPSLYLALRPALPSAQTEPAGTSEPESE